MRAKGKSWKGTGLRTGAGLGGWKSSQMGSNLGIPLHGVPQLTLHMGGILIGLAQRLLLVWEEKDL